jgi:hypothetical protein
MALPSVLSDLLSCLKELIDYLHRPKERIMKKIACLIILLAGISAFSLDSAYAQSELELWCIAQGETWDPVTFTCTVNGSATVSTNAMLSILLGETLYNYGTIDNAGNIVNNGTIIITGYHGANITNDGTIQNIGTFIITGYHGANITNDGTIHNVGYIENITIINNNGRIVNETNSHIYNIGTINNFGTIDNFRSFNDGTIANGINGTINNFSLTNFGTIDNDGTITNYGEIENLGTITNDVNGSITNIGTINHWSSGTFANTGTIHNWGTITNDGTIQNNGAIYNICGGIYFGNPPEGNPIIENCSYTYLPICKDE